MKTRVMLAVIAVMAGTLLAPAAFAQRRSGGGMGSRGGGGMSRPASGFQQRAAPVTDPRNSPTSPIQPMTNPVAPMMNAPVQPFANYLNTPSAARSVRGQGDGFRGDHRGNRDVVVVGGGGFYQGYYPGFYPDPLYYAPLLSPPPVPGQIPYTFPLPLYSPAPIPGQLPYTVPLLPEQTVPVVDPVQSPVIDFAEPTYFSEPRIIVPTEVVTIRELPALGATRSDVFTRYGEPWGVVMMKGKETTYFRGGLVVVFENGRAVDVQKR